MEASASCTLEIRLFAPEATQELGRRLAECLQGHMFIALTGNLGAGKTTLVQGIGAGLGVHGPVVSPTFTMLNEYDDGRLPLFHLDMYRLSDAELGEAVDMELLKLELVEISCGRNLIVIEWADLVDGCLAGRDHVLVHLDYGDDHDEPERRATISSTGKNSLSVVKGVAKLYL